jgi:hypothetical protein
LRSIFPEYEWDPLRFARAPQHFWQNKDNQRILFNRLAQKLNIRKPEDWYNVSARQIKKNGGWTVLSDYYSGSLLKGMIWSYNCRNIVALQGIYPDQAWDPAKFHNLRWGFWKDTNNQRNLIEKLGELFSIFVPRN